MPYEYSVIVEIEDTAENIWMLETNLKSKLKSKYIPKIAFAGSMTECYTDLEEITQALEKAL